MRPAREGSDLKTFSARRQILGIGLLVSLAVMPSAAAGRPLSPSSERSDNTMSFDYDAVSGEIGEAVSGRVISRRDRLEFVAWVRDFPEAEVGERLQGAVHLRVHRDKAIELRGTLAVVVQNDAGATIETLEREIDIVLRDRKGKRAKSFRWRFDLPTGNYTVFGTFQK